MGSPGKENSVISSGYGDWSQLEFSDEELQGDRTDPDDDFDGDGIINLHEYAFGLSPKALATQESLPRVEIMQNNGAQSVAIHFQKLADANDVSITVQRSHDMFAWTVINEGAALDNEDGTMKMIYFDPLNSDDGKVFFRLIVELVVP